MHNIQLNYNKGYQWYSKKNIFIKGYAFDKQNNLLEKEQFAEYFEGIINQKTFEEKLGFLNGLFSVIIVQESKIFLSSDITRTFPLFYTIENNEIFISDDSFYLKDKFSSQMDEFSEKEFLTAGYVTGKKTLLKNIYQLQAGELLIYDVKIKTSFYSDYITRQIKASPYQKLQEEFSQILDKVAQRIINFANGRKLILPLSGGYDSRLIASLLKKHNYTNVLCFTYGDEKSYEKKNAEKVAKKLGFEWVFIAYDKELVRKNYLFNKENIPCVKYISNNVTMPHSQTFIALKYLTENHTIPEDSIFIPGHTGDFIAGKHLWKTLISRKTNIIKNIIKKHYLLNNYIDKKIFLKKIKGQLKLDETNFTYSLDENWNMKERQSKFIINTNRIFEYYNYKHLLPLWDKDLVNFFKEIPVKYKTRKVLYDNTLLNHLFNNYTIDFENSSNSNFKHEYLLRTFKLILKNTISDFIVVKLKKIIKRNLTPHSNTENIENLLFKDSFESDVNKLDINFIYASMYLKLIKKN